MTILDAAEGMEDIAAGLKTNARPHDAPSRLAIGVAESAAIEMRLLAKLQEEEEPARKDTACPTT